MLDKYREDTGMETFDDVMFANEELTRDMRDWLADCADCYTDITADEIDDVPRATIWRIVERDYEGGVAGFVRDNG